MAYDPVLDREMFRPRSKGVEALRDREENEDVRARREQALAMIEAAKQKFDPSNFQTLTEQDRPGVFRPVAVNIPAQQQTADTAMRMQQMAAQGVRPVGMADGGSVDNYMDAPDTISPTISTDPTSVGRIQALGSRIRSIGSMQAPTSNLGVSAPDTAASPSGLEDNPFGGLDLNDPTSWTDEEIMQAAEVAARKAAREGTAGTRFGRALQKANPFDIKTNAQEIADSLRTEREMAREAAKNAGMGNKIEEIKKTQEGIKAIEKRTPVPGLFEPSTPEQVTAAEEARSSALSEAEKARIADKESGGIKNLGLSAPELPAALYGFDRTEEAPKAGLPNLGVPVAEPAAAPTGLESLKKPPVEEAPAKTPQAPSAPAPAKAAEAAGAAATLPDMSQAGPTDMQQIKAERARAREENINLALIRAGLGIMAGKSSNALSNIGEGAQAGISAFTEGEKTAQQQMREGISDLREQQKMAQDKAYRNAMLGFEKTKSDMERERLGLARDAAAQSRSEFDQTLAFKNQESKNALASAEATRDATAIREASRQISELRTTLITRIQMLQSSNQATLDPVGTKNQIDALTRQLESAEEDAKALRRIQGINIPSQSATSSSMSSDPLGLRGK